MALLPQPLGAAAGATGASLGLPLWMRGPYHDIMRSRPIGPPIGDADVASVFFQPLPDLNRVRTPLGLSLAPHTHGLVVRAVRSWAANDAQLTAGNIILSVDSINPPDWTGMVAQLMTGFPCNLSLVSSLATDWTWFPENRNVHI